MKIYKMILSFFLICLGAVSLVRYTNNMDLWLVDIFSNFTVQYTFLAFILFVICLRKRIYSLMFLAGILCLFNLGTFAEFGSSVDASINAKEAFTVYSANINKNNENLSELINEIIEKNAEIVLLLEVTPEHAEQLNAVIQTYPYHIIETPMGINGLGLVLLSKFPILNHKVTELSEFGNALVEAELIIKEETVLFYGAHFPRPGFMSGYPGRSMQFLKLANQIKMKSMPSIIAGDFNATPFSPVFKNFLQVSGLKDTRKGFGWQPTWPVFFPGLWIPIDHILVSPEIQVNKRSTGSYIGSDHYPVIAELSI